MLVSGHCCSKRVKLLDFRLKCLLLDNAVVVKGLNYLNLDSDVSGQCTTNRVKLLHFRLKCLFLDAAVVNRLNYLILD